MTQGLCGADEYVVIRRGESSRALCGQPMLRSPLRIMRIAYHATDTLALRMQTRLRKERHARAGGAKAASVVLQILAHGALERMTGPAAAFLLP